MQKILIIEDDKFLGDVLLQKLISDGFDTKLIKDGNLAINEIKEFQPDLILLDILLPNFNGYEILEEKQKDESIKDIPVIILSNSGQPVEISRALNLGVKDYLVKAHFDPEEVLVKVKQQFGNISSGVGKTVSNRLKGKTIMWVEDDQFLSDLIERKMSKINCNFVHVIRGDEVIDRLKQITPDIIMLDILLPGMNGLEILTAIKNNKETRDIPVIIISNMNQASDLRKYKELGAVDFIVKADFSLDEIFNRISSLIK